MVRDLLAQARVYSLFARLIGATRGRQDYVQRYIRPRPGDRVLDIGCGPADILEALPEMDYTGFDISPEYIASARKRFGNRARFLCEDVGAASIEREQGTFDLVLATGVVHHLEDEQALKLFDLARRALRSQGRLITFDGCYVPGQSRFARWMLDKDRGRFVRSREEYSRLASLRFSRVESHVRHDLLRIPYTHLILICSHE